MEFYNKNKIRAFKEERYKKKELKIQKKIKAAKSRKEKETPYPEGPFVVLTSVGASIDLVDGLHLINNEATYANVLLALIGTSIMIGGIYKWYKIDKYGIPDEDLPKYLEPY